jgi:opacity protein-like surface antigen
MRRKSFVAAVLIATSVHASSLGAQSFPGRPIQVGLMGGFTLPAGDLTLNSNHAGNAGALVTFGGPHSRLRFRLDGQRQQLTGKTFGGDPVPGSGGFSTESFRQRDIRILDATANAVLSGALFRSARVYVLGGVGLYNVRETTRFYGGELLSESSAASGTRVGLNGGIGVSAHLGRVATFVETRYHRLFGSATFEKNVGFIDKVPGAFQFVPISAGIIF